VRALTRIETDVSPKSRRKAPRDVSSAESESTKTSVDETSEEQAKKHRASAPARTPLARGRSQLSIHSCPFPAKRDQPARGRGKFEIDSGTLRRILWEHARALHAA